MPKPGFGTRLKLAAKALTGLFNDQSGTEAYSLLSGLYPTHYGTWPKRGTKELLEGYSELPWLRAVSQKIAHSVAQTQWQLWTPTSKRRLRTIQRAVLPQRPQLIQRAIDAGALKPVEDHPLLDAIEDANPFLVGDGLLRVTQVHLDLVGEAFWIKDRNGVGAPAGFWPLPPNWVLSTPTPSNRFYRVGFTGWQGDIPDTEIIWFADPDPANPYGRGSGLARTLSDELETDEYAARHCHDDQTECLTRRGWVRGIDLLDDDEIATWNPTTQRTEYHRPLHITRARYIGDIHHWHGQRVDARVTPTHRLWIERRNGNDFATNKQRQPLQRGWHFEESRQAATTPGKPFYWRDTGRFDGGITTVEIPAVARITKRKVGSRGGGRPPTRGVNDPLRYDAEQFAAFLGYYVSEGCLGRATLQLDQSIGKYVDDIRQALSVFPLEWIREEYRPQKAKTHWSPTYRWTFSHLGLAEWIRKEVGCGAENKRLPRCVFEWSRAAQLELLRTLINGDGSRDRCGDACAYFSISDGLLDDVQRLCVQVGWSSYKAVNTHHGGHILRIRTDSHARLLNAKGGRKADGRAWVETQPYDGIVWCVTVPNELFFSRRNGRVMLGGNTRMTFLNRARPDLIIWPEETKHDSGVISKANADRLGEQWRADHQGFWKAALPFFATRKMGVYEVGQSFADLQLTELRKHERDIIIQVFGVPPEELGIIENSNRATVAAADFLFKKNVILPRLEFLRSYFQARLIPEYDDRLIVGYISPVEEDREFQLSAATVAPWALTVDEWRGLMEHQPLPDGSGAVHVLSNTLTTVSDLASPPPIPAPFLAATLPPVRRALVLDGLIGLSAGPAGDVLICQEAKDAAVGAALARAEAEAGGKPGWPLILRQAASQEPAFRRLVAGTIALLRDGVTRADLARAIPAGPAAVLALVDLNAWRADAVNAWEPSLVDAYMKGAAAGAREANLRIGEKAPQQVPFNVMNPLALRWAQQSAARLVVEIDTSTREGLRDTIAEALEEGWGAETTANILLPMIGLTRQHEGAVMNFMISLLADGVAEETATAKATRYAEALHRYRAMNIARTEIMTAANEGQHRLWEEASDRGLLDLDRLERQWMAVADACDECLPLDGETVGFDEAFKGGYDQPPAHPSCRCVIGLVRKAEQASLGTPLAIATLAPLLASLDRIGAHLAQQASPTINVTVPERAIQVNAAPPVAPRKKRDRVVRIEHAPDGGIIARVVARPKAHAVQIRPLADGLTVQVLDGASAELPAIDRAITIAEPSLQAIIKKEQ